MVVNPENAPPIKLSLIHFDEPVSDLENKVTRCFCCGKKISAKDVFVHVQSVSILCPDCTNLYNSLTPVFQNAMIGSCTLKDYEVNPKPTGILNHKRRKKYVGD